MKKATKRIWWWIPALLVFVVGLLSTLILEGYFHDHTVTDSAAIITAVLTMATVVVMGSRTE